jgi:mRNA-degrading endonuclease RelE of RelBE toxin-antitoxin system
MAAVEMTPAAADDLTTLPGPIKARMIKLMGRLRRWPTVSGVKRLKGDLVGKYRLRTGDYRLQFHVDESKKKVHEKKVVNSKEATTEREVVEYSVVVEKMGHRDGFYGD